MKQAILEITCNGQLIYTKPVLELLDVKAKNELAQLEQEGLLSLSSTGITVTDLCKGFNRNICMVFD